MKLILEVIDYYYCAYILYTHSQPWSRNINISVPDDITQCNRELR